MFLFRKYWFIFLHILKLIEKILKDTCNNIFQTNFFVPKHQSINFIFSYETEVKRILPTSTSIEIHINFLNKCSIFRLNALFHFILTTLMVFIFIIFFWFRTTKIRSINKLSNTGSENSLGIIWSRLSS